MAKHRGEPVSRKDKKAAEKAQEESDARFWEDVAEAVGVLPHDPDDPRNKKARKAGKHRRG